MTSRRPMDAFVSLCDGLYPSSYVRIFGYTTGLFCSDHTTCSVPCRTSHVVPLEGHTHALYGRFGGCSAAVQDDDDDDEGQFLRPSGGGLWACSSRTKSQSSDKCRVARCQKDGQTDGRTDNRSKAKMTLLFSRFIRNRHHRCHCPTVGDREN